MKLIILTKKLVGGVNKDKRFWYYGVSLKNLIFRGGFIKKTIYRGDCLEREGAWTVCRLKRGLDKKDRVVFLKEC